MKLKRDALGVVSLGVGVQKDQLIQAVGRMRELGPGRQTVRFAVPSEVCAQLRQTDTELNSNGFLNWSIRSSTSGVSAGLSQWTSQGMHFHRLRPIIETFPTLACENLKLDLEFMYSDAVGKFSMAEYAQAERERCVSETGSHLPQSSVYCVDDIVKRVEDLGAGFTTRATLGIGEECERELENEREFEEEEVATEVPKSTPRMEIDWDYSKILLATNASDIIEISGAKYIGDFIKSSLKGATFQENDFKHIYATENFLEAVDLGSGVTRFMMHGEANFLRNVDMCIAFGSQMMLLVSEREADCILGLFWDACKHDGAISDSAASLTISNFRYLCQSKTRDEIPLGLQCRAQERGQNKFTDDALAALQIFNGDTNYRGKDGRSLPLRLKAVRQIANTTPNREDLLKFAVARGKSIHVPGLDLDQLLKDD